MEVSDLITAKQAASLKNWQPSTFAYYKRTGRTPKAILIAGRELFSKKEILAWEPARNKPGVKTK